MNRDIRAARKIYIDANIVIYFAESDDENQDKADAIFAYAAENSIPLITSEITIAECLRGIYGEGKDTAREKYNAIFYETGFFRLVPVARKILEYSAMIGAENRLKLIDAIHVTSAIAAECDVFLTNDRGIRSTDDLKVVYLSEI